MSHIVFTSLFSLSSKCRELAARPPPWPFSLPLYVQGTWRWRPYLNFHTYEADNTTPSCPWAWFFLLWSSTHDSSPITSGQWHFHANISCRPPPQLPPYPAETLANGGVGPGCLHTAGSLWQHLWESEDCLGQTGVGEEVFLIFYSHDINRIIVPGVLGVLGRGRVKFQWCWMQRSIFQPLPRWKTIDFCKRTAGAAIMFVLNLGFCDELSRIKQDQCQDQNVCRSNHFLQMRLYPTYSVWKK